MPLVRFEEENIVEDEKYFSTLLEAGVSTITEFQIDPAIKIFKEIKELYPEEPQAYFYLANLHTIKDQKVEALKNYELAWKNDQLVFRLTPFDNVVTELEKWYDINISLNIYLIITTIRTIFLIVLIEIITSIAGNHIHYIRDCPNISNLCSILFRHTFPL